MAGSVLVNVFTEILNQSISASWLILAVIVIRAFMKKTPKSLRYVLWGFVAVRLLCPVFLESTWSLVPNIEVRSKQNNENESFDSVAVGDAENLDESKNEASGMSENQQDNLQNMEAEEPNKDIGDERVEVLPDEVVDITDLNTNRFSMQAIFPIAAGIWMLGMVVIGFRSVISVIRLKNKVAASLQIGENIWMCDEIQSPFVLGVISPRIYVPSFITEEQLPFILAHENEHLKYRDHWWKPVGFAILTFYWFNPLVWAAYILLCRDMELACDERVIRQMNEEEKKQYSKSLLICNNPRHMIFACPVAFGEIGVKERVKNILDYKKPSTWIVAMGVIVCIIIAVCFMTNPKTITLDLDVEAIAKIELRSGMTGKIIEITDENEIFRITAKINKLEFQKKGSAVGHGGWSYWLIWYDAQGNEIESFTTVGDNRIAREDYFYQCVNGTLDKDYYKELLQEFANAENSTENESVQETVEVDGTKPFGVSGTSLTKEEVDWFATVFFNSDDNHMPNMFLSGEYDCYLPEYGAYYNVAGDTEYRRLDILAGWRCADGTIFLPLPNSWLIVYAQLVSKMY